MANEFNIKNGFKSNGDSSVSGKLTTEKLTITSGATNGYVLVSDASGNAVWQPPTVDTNVYNTDGTITGNRTIDLDGNTVNFVDGNIGVNKSIPGATLHVEGTAIPSTNENLFRVTVSDVSGTHFTIQNGTTGDGTFVPKTLGRQTSTSNETAVNYAGVIDSTQDSGTKSVVLFQSHLNTLDAVVIRPLFQWKNWSTNMMTMLANGSLGIGTTTPTERVEVSGKTKTIKLQVTSGATNGYVLTSDASGNATWVAPVALTYFSEAQNTTAPNATVPVDSLTAVSVATDTDFAILPKGAGAILADIPDGTVAGGNKRGQYAVDLQMARLTNASVASGNYSVISGGYYNTASNTQSTVGGGYQNTASGPQSTIGGGQQNGASSDFSTVGGGTNNTASGSRTTVAGGASNTATAYGAATLGGFGNVSTGNYSSNVGGLSNSSTGDNSTVLGGASNSASGSYSICGGANSVANSIYGVALGGGSTTNSVIYRQTYGVRHTVNGDAQSSTFIMRMRTTDDTLTNFTSDGTSAASNNQVILPNQSAFRFKGTIIAKQSGSVNSAAWDIDGFIVRGANAASTTLNISNVTVIQNTPGWGTPTLAADTTQGGLRIQIQGAITTNIQWVADIKTTEVIYT